MKSEAVVREARAALEDLLKISDEMGLKSFREYIKITSFCDLLSWVLDEENSEL